MQCFWYARNGPLGWIKNDAIKGILESQNLAAGGAFEDIEANSLLSPTNAPKPPCAGIVQSAADRVGYKASTLGKPAF